MNQELLNAIFDLQSSINTLNASIEGTGINYKSMLFFTGIIAALAFILGLKNHD